VRSPGDGLTTEKPSGFQGTTESTENGVFGLGLVFTGWVKTKPTG
jgi:hypothetical protein